MFDTSLEESRVWLGCLWLILTSPDKIAEGNSRRPPFSVRTQLCTFSTFPAVPQRALCYTWHQGHWSSLESCSDTVCCHVSPRSWPWQGSKRHLCRSFAEAGQRRRVRASSLCPLMPLNNSRLEDPGFFDILSKFSLTIFKDSQMPKSYHRKLIVRNKPKQEHPNAALHLGFYYSKLLSEASKRV